MSKVNEDALVFVLLTYENLESDWGMLITKIN